MRTLFVVSDVHGFFTEMMRALDNAGFDKNNKNHVFVSCGDLLDRGSQNKECLQFVNNLENKILIDGNHEDLLQEAIYRGYLCSHDYHNGTDETIYQLTGIHPDKDSNIDYVSQTALTEMSFNEDWNKYSHSLINYYETEEYIFVHGWIPIKSEIVYDTSGVTRIPTVKNSPVYNPEWRNPFAEWKQARWLNGMSMWQRGIREPDKTIICGHWHSSWGHANIHRLGVEFAETVQSDPSIHSPFYDDGIIALDACTVYSRFVNCIKLEVEDE